MFSNVRLHWQALRKLVTITTLQMPLGRSLLVALMLVKNGECPSVTMQRQSLNVALLRAGALLISLWHF